MKKKPMHLRQHEVMLEQPDVDVSIRCRDSSDGGQKIALKVGKKNLIPG